MHTKFYFTILALCCTMLAVGGSVKASDSDSASTSSSSSSEPKPTIWDRLTPKNPLTPNEIRLCVEAIKEDGRHIFVAFADALSACKLNFTLNTMRNKDGELRVAAINYVMLVITNVTTPILMALIESGIVYPPFLVPSKMRVSFISI